MSALAIVGAVLAAVLPVFFVAGAGFVVRRAFPLDARTLSTLNLYIFIPSLIFANLSVSTIEWSVFGRCAAAALLLVAGMTAVMSMIARARGLTGHDRNAFLMSLFPNLGNFGLPVVRFAFGEEYLALALVILVCGSLLQNTVGIYFAQRSHHGMLKAMARVLGFPMVYAFALALLCSRMQWETPEIVYRAIRITAEAAIPVQLMILGVKLAETRLDLRVDALAAVGCRLILGPLLAFGIAYAVGLRGVPAKVFILQVSGPVAVAMAVYGVQFNVKPAYLASVVSVSFLCSVVTVSIVLSLLYVLPLP
ncbi:MAG: AEC family transporter [bacterium]|nr:AEC family transporter [bacterium]